MRPQDPNSYHGVLVQPLAECNPAPGLLLAQVMSSPLVEANPARSAIDAAGRFLTRILTSSTTPLQTGTSTTEIQGVLPPEAIPVAQADIIERCTIDRAEIVEIEPRQLVLGPNADLFLLECMCQELASASCCVASSLSLTAICCSVFCEGFDRAPDEAVLRDQACNILFKQSIKCDVTDESCSQGLALAFCKDRGPQSPNNQGSACRFFFPSTRLEESNGATTDLGTLSDQLDEMMNGGQRFPSAVTCCIASTP